jgi:hypothetical protein
MGVPDRRFRAPEPVQPAKRPTLGRTPPRLSLRVLRAISPRTPPFNQTDSSKFQTPPRLMKFKRLIRSEPEVLRLESPAADDPSLPLPRGGKLFPPRHRSVDIRERGRLFQTRVSGGLVADTGPYAQRWICTSCGELWPSYEKARLCCGAGVSRVQICSNCGKRLHQCNCPKRFPATPPSTPST